MRDHAGVRCVPHPTITVSLQAPQEGGVSAVCIYFYNKHRLVKRGPVKEKGIQVCEDMPAVILSRRPKA